MISQNKEKEDYYSKGGYTIIVKTLNNSTKNYSILARNKVKDVLKSILSVLVGKVNIENDSGDVVERYNNTARLYNSFSDVSDKYSELTGYNQRKMTPSKKVELNVDESIITGLWKKLDTKAVNWLKTNFGENVSIKGNDIQIEEASLSNNVLDTKGFEKHELINQNKEKEDYYSKDGYTIVVKTCNNDGTKVYYVKTEKEALNSLDTTLKSLVYYMTALSANNVRNVKERYNNTVNLYNKYVGKNAYCEILNDNYRLNLTDNPDMVSLTVYSSSKSNMIEIQNFLTNNINIGLGSVYDCGRFDGKEIHVVKRFDISKKASLSEENLDRLGFKKHIVLDRDKNKEEFYYRDKNDILFIKSTDSENRNYYAVADKQNAKVILYNRLKAASRHPDETKYNTTVDLYEKLGGGQGKYKKKIASSNKVKLNINAKNKESAVNWLKTNFGKENVSIGENDIQIEEASLSNDVLISKRFEKESVVFNQNKGNEDHYNKDGYTITVKTLNNGEKNYSIEDEIEDEVISDESNELKGSNQEKVTPSKKAIVTMDINAFKNRETAVKWLKANFGEENVFTEGLTKIDEASLNRVLNSEEFEKHELTNQNNEKDYYSKDGYTITVKTSANGEKYIILARNVKGEDVSDKLNELKDSDKKKITPSNKVNLSTDLSVHNVVNWLKMSFGENVVSIEGNNIQIEEDLLNRVLNTKGFEKRELINQNNEKDYYYSKDGCTIIVKTLNSDTKNYSILAEDKVKDVLSSVLEELSKSISKNNNQEVRERYSNALRLYKEFGGKLDKFKELTDKEEKVTSSKKVELYVDKSIPVKRLKIFDGDVVKWLKTNFGEEKVSIKGSNIQIEEASLSSDVLINKGFEKHELIGYSREEEDYYIRDNYTIIVKTPFNSNKKSYSIITREEALKGLDTKLKRSVHYMEHGLSFSGVEERYNNTVKLYNKYVGKNAYCEISDNYKLNPLNYPNMVSVTIYSDSENMIEIQNFLSGSINSGYGLIYDHAYPKAEGEYSVSKRFDVSEKTSLSEENLDRLGFKERIVLDIGENKEEFYYRDKNDILFIKITDSKNRNHYAVADKQNAKVILYSRLKAAANHYPDKTEYNATVDLYVKLGGGEKDFSKIDFKKNN